QIILRLMAKKPEERYATPEALISAVQGVRDGVTADERATLYNETLRIDPADGKAAVDKTPAPPKSLGPAPLVFTLIAAALLLGVAGYYVVDAIRSGPAPAEPQWREVASTGSGVLEKPLPPSNPPSNPPPAVPGP